jgi:predicted ATPase
MIQAIAGGKSLPAEVLDQIVARTDGVPLFVEELTKTLLESGLLRESEDRYVLAAALPTLAIPATLHDSLLARLDRLGQAKDTAQLGAAIGREFSYELLAAVSTLDDARLRTALSQLTSAGLLFRRGNPPDASYTFKHALVRDAAYSSLLKSRRQQIHARIAQALNEKFPERAATAPELLAHHHGEAGASELAVHYWERAGSRALERSANVEAVAHFRAGLAVLKDLDEESRVRSELPLQIGLGSALSSVRGYTDPGSRAAYRRARDICLDLGEKDRLFPVLYGLWNFDVVAGKYHEAKEVSRQFVTLAEQHGASGPLVAAYSAMGTTSTFMGSWSDGSRYAQASIKPYDPGLHASLKFEGADDPCVQAGLVDALSLWNLGYPDGALKAIGQAVKLAEELRHANSQGYAMAMVPLLHQFIGNAREAAATAEYCKEFSRKAYLPLWVAYSMVWRGWAQACLGNHAEGIAELQEGMEGWNAAGSQAHTSGMLAALGDACRAAGRFEDAMHAVDRGIQFVAESGEGLREAELNRLKGVLLLRMDASASSDGENWLLRALEIARQQESRSMELRIAIDLARLWRSQGKVGEARSLLAPIHGWFTEGLDTPSLKDAKALLDTLA